MVNSTEIEQKKKRGQGMRTFLAFALLPLASFATDIYIPSLPNMAQSLHVSNIQVQLTVSIFLISYGFSQLFMGGILDSFGRYNLGVLALFIFAAASFILATSHNIHIIYAMRALHGLTAAAIVVGKRAYFVDVFSGKELEHYLSLFTIVWSTGPIVAPFLGGYLETTFGWSSNFYLLAAMAAVLGVLEYIFGGESLPYFTKFRFKNILSIYANMLRTPSFLLGLFIIGLSYCTVMVYSMTGPFIIQYHLHFTPAVAGYCSLILGLAWMVGGVIGKVTIQLPFIKKLVTNMGVQLLVIAIMLISARFVDDIYFLVGFAFLVHASAGFAFTVYFTYCLAKFPKNAGIASGLTGGAMFVITSLLSYATVYFIPEKDMSNLGYSYLAMAICATIIMVIIFNLRGREANES